MLFFYDRNSEKSGREQFLSYLNSERSLNRLKHSTTDLINYQLTETRRAINATSHAQKNAIENLSGQICGTLEKGFNAITEGIGQTNWYLNATNEKLDSILLLLDWKTDIIIEELKIANCYLGNIERLLNKPEQFKKSCAYLERGMVMFTNAIQGGPGSSFYTEAYEDFYNAYKNDDRDFLCLQMLGLIHLNSEKYLSPQKAWDYFTSSSRYAIAFSKTTSSTFNRTYLPAFSKETLLREGVNALVYASRCCYILNKNDDGITLINYAIQLQPDNLEIKFLLAKYLSANGQIQVAIEVLEKLIQANEHYSVRLLSERDLYNQPVISMMERLYADLERRIITTINGLKPLKAILQNDYIVLMKPIENLMAEKNYLNLRKVERELFNDFGGLSKLMPQMALNKQQKKRTKRNDNILSAIIIVPLLIFATTLWFNSLSGIDSETGNDVRATNGGKIEAFLILCICSAVIRRKEGLEQSVTVSFGVGAAGLMLGAVVGFFCNNGDKSNDMIILCMQVFAAMFIAIDILQSLLKSLD